MSYSDQDPNPYQQPGQSEQFPQQPGVPPDYAAYAPPKRSRLWLWILLGAGVVVLLCCGGVGLLVYVNMGNLEDQIAERLNENPVIQEHIGTVESCEIDLIASGEEKQRTGAGYMDQIYVCDVQGSKAGGTVTVEVLPQPGSVQILSGTLKLSTGEEYDLFGSKEEADDSVTEEVEVP